MLRSAVFGASLLASCISVAAAQEPAAAPPAAEPAANPAQAAWDAANKVAVRGPSSVRVKDQATLAVPENMAFIPTPEASALMALMGNQTGETFAGLIMPMAETTDWFVTVNYEPSGYIHDDDAKDWDADHMLEGLKAGTEAGNQFRAERNIAPIEVAGWIEKPTYDAAAHRLIWSVEVRDKGTQPSPDQVTVNYNTYVLGREGYVSLDLVTSAALVGGLKPVAQTLLAGIAFDDGKRYADFNPQTDRVAEYGLAALIGGVAAKKLGLFAMLGVMLAKFWKIGLIAVVAAAAAFRKLFRRKDAVPAAPTA